FMVSATGFWRIENMMQRLAPNLQFGHYTLLHQLGFRLMAAFALIIGLVILVTVVLTRQGTDTQFAHFMVDDQMIRTSQLITNLVTYYQQKGSWAGLDNELDEVLLVASDGTMGPMMQGMMGLYENRMQILDGAALVVADTDAANPSPLLSAQQWPIMLDGQLIGTLLVQGAMMGHTTLDSEAVLRGVTRAVVVAGSVAGLVALLMAGLLIRQITRPITGLTHASRQIAAGDLTTRVPLQSHDELGELAQTFNQMASSLELQERARRNLIADVAHELRTPLAGIQGTIEAFQDGVFAPTAENFAHIHQEVLLLNRLVEDLRTVANADAGTLTLDFATVDLAALVQRQVAAFQVQAHDQQIALQVTVREPIAAIQGDEERLRQVFNNLLDNALRHTPAGGLIELTLANVPDGVH
ncbi:MAG: HAMP domain-containing protein, partial [Caldilineaceae bacterium]|nr:HAMP domain-containing protein [Caldilineaceae bacterium]